MLPTQTARMNRSPAFLPLCLCLAASLACCRILQASASEPKTCLAGGSCSAEDAEVPGAGKGGESAEPTAREPLAAPDPEAVAKVERLLQWAEENFNMTGLRGPDAAFTVVISGDTTEVKNPDEPKRKARPSYGLAARRDFKQGEMVLNFPPEMLIRADRLLNASRDPDDLEHPPLFNITGQEEEEDDLGWGQFVAVAAFLLRERAKGEDSFWAPFLAVLPEHVALPIYWSDEFVGALEYEPAEGVVLGYKEAFKVNWEKINPAAVANASQAEFYWALSLACSRLFDASKPSHSDVAFYVDPAGDDEGDLQPPMSEEEEEAMGTGTSLAMLPVADFLNHATSYSVEWIVDQREGKGKKLLKMGQSTMPTLQRTISLRFSAVQDISAGSELTTTYGTQNNDHLLLSYSFVLSPNVFDDFLVASGPLQVLDLFQQVQRRRDEVQRRLDGGDGAEVDPLELERELLLDFPASPFWNDSGLAPEEVIIRSNRAVQEVKPTYVEWELLSEPKYEAVEVVEASADKADDEEAQPRYALWGDGDLDPRLLVAFAALRYVELYSQEPSYGALALAAIPFAWDLMEADCHSYSQNMTNEELQVLQEAAADLKMGLQIVSEGFSTTADQDRLALFELRECQKRQFRNESGGQLVVAGGIEVECSDNLEKHQREWEMILLFRMVKKAIIRDARKRLEDRCIHPTSPLTDWNDGLEQGDPEDYDEAADPEADLQDA